MSNEIGSASCVEYTEQSHIFLFLLLGTSSFSFINSTVERRVISPGEKIEMVHVYDSAQAKAIDSLLLWNNSPHKFALEICYCSVYNDCWATDGTTSKESSCQ